jgi:T-complex protein 1 subunit gamma
VADIIRTTLGPRSMLKMILDSMGQIHTTSDGNAILREVDVTHPAAKNIIQLSRTQDEEVGDGTTSVIILAGEILSIAEPFIIQGIHPTKIVRSFFVCLEDALKLAESLAITLDTKDNEKMGKVIQSCLGTKFTKKQSTKLAQIALDSVRTVHMEKDIDIKRYVRVEKIPGGNWEETRVIQGVILNKDVLHPSMKRKIANPRILLLDSGLEFKKSESQTNVEIEKAEDYSKLLGQEDKFVKKLCDDIIKIKPDLVISEKGISDLAIHYLQTNGIAALRRVRKTDNERLARATGAKIVNVTNDLRESDLGTCGLYEVRKIGDEYYSFIEECKGSRACTVLLRGPSKDVLSEIERNLADAMAVVRNIILDPRIVPGGGAFEMALSQALLEKAKSVKGIEQKPYEALAQALEVIPRTLADNCGVKSIKVVTELRAKHSGGKNTTWGIDGTTGVVTDMAELGIWDPFTVKTQAIKTSIESACLLLRIDDVVSGISKKKKDKSGNSGSSDPMMGMEDMM